MKRYLFIILIIVFQIIIFSGVDEPGDVLQLTADTEKKYGVPFYFSGYDKIPASTSFNADYSFDNNKYNDDAYLYWYLNIFTQEWNLYPVELVQKSRLKGIAFVRDLKFGKLPIPAYVDADIGVIYFNIYYGEYYDEFTRTQIHQSFYRILEKTFYGTMNYKDADWIKNNPKGFNYKERPQKGAEGSEYSYIEHPENGFVNTEALYSADTDKAETYCYLFINKKYNRIEKWMKNDFVLKQKMQYLINFIRKVSPSFTDEYIKSIHKPLTEKEIESEREMELESASFSSTSSAFESSSVSSAFVSSEAKTESIISAKDKLKQSSSSSSYKSAEKSSASIQTKSYSSINVILQEKKSVIEEICAEIPSKYYLSGFYSFVKNREESILDIGDLTPEKLVEAAKSYLGVPYKFGKCSKYGVDCSAVMYLAFKENGLEVPRGMIEMAQYGKLIPKSRLKKGDVIFFTATWKTNNYLTHVGICIGEGLFINANSYYGRVMIEDYNDDYWKKYLIFGTRVF